MAVAVALLAIAGGGGYFVWQDQQDRAARAALTDYVQAQQIADAALEHWHQHKQRLVEQIQKDRPTEPDPDEAAFQESKKGAVWQELDEKVKAARRLEERWGARWRALGIHPGR